MPLYVSVPLPGPFRYGARLGPRGPRRRRTRWQQPLYWLTGLAVLELSLRALYGCLWLLAAGARWAWRAVQRARARRPR